MFCSFTENRQEMMCAPLSDPCLESLDLLITSSREVKQAIRELKHLRIQLRHHPGCSLTINQCVLNVTH